jgi:ParB-like chromosome segregation protein Spo0J
MLDWPEPEKPSRQPPRIIGTFDTVPVGDISCHPVNPREGDIGAISRSLEENGQYRPIIVNRRTMRVIVGNHTYVAARTIGWDMIAVHWIDVDEIEEAKILLIDNRTSDLATYDTDALVALLMSTSLAGTGYDADDLDAIIGGGRSRPGPAPTGQTSIAIDDYRWRTPTDVYDRWAELPRDPVGSLGIPYNAVMENR